MNSYQASSYKLCQGEDSIDSTRIFERIVYLKNHRSFKILYTIKYVKVKGIGWEWGGLRALRHSFLVQQYSNPKLNWWRYYSGTLKVSFPSWVAPSVGSFYQLLQAIILTEEGCKYEPSQSNPHSITFSLKTSLSLWGKFNLNWPAKTT